MKGILLKYETTMFQSLNSDTFDFNLTLSVGLLFKREKIIKFGVPHHANLKAFTDNWDELIKNQSVIKI